MQIAHFRTPYIITFSVFGVLSDKLSIAVLPYPDRAVPTARDDVLQRGLNVAADRVRAVSVRSR